MSASGKCLCGFAELEDETIMDHLHAVFMPDDMVGSDGLPHGENDALACLCGFIAIMPEELDGHFLKVFTPGNSTGRDGRKHIIT